MLYTEFWDESANEWDASNQSTVYTNKTTATKPIVIDGTSQVKIRLYGLANIICQELRQQP